MVLSHGPMGVAGVSAPCGGPGGVSVSGERAEVEKDSYSLLERMPTSPAILENHIDIPQDLLL